MEHLTIASLSPVQAQVSLSLAAGASISSAAHSAKLRGATIYTWLQNEANFTAAVEQAKAEYILTLRDHLRDASAKALATITAILDDPTAPASVRLKAALAILNRPQFPDPGWLLPEKIGTDADRHQRLAGNANRTELNTSEQNIQDSTQPSSGTNLNTSEHPNGLFATPQPVHVQKLGRNKPCPCNSGKKFKRCCRGKSEPAATPIHNPPSHGLS